jgi:D-alanine-D-alanine ligase
MPPSIVLLHDAAAAAGRPDASDTLLEAQAIAAALERLGYATTTLPVGLDLGALERALHELAPQAVFNLVESLEGRGRLLPVVPALLASLGVPFTGCSAEALAATSHKPAAKRLLRQAEIATPATLGSAAGDGTKAGDGMWIVKSVFEHSSLGIDDSSVVAGAEAARRVLAARRAELGGEWFAERFVPGRELNVGIVAAPEGSRVLPVAELRFENFPAGKPAIVGYAAKWDVDSFEYRHTVRSFDVEPELAARAERLAAACWELFELDGHARVDFRVDSFGMLFVLEVNANPCLAPDAGFAAALAQAGIDFDEAIGWLIADARRSAPSERRA